MSSIDPMLLLAGKQPKKKMIRIEREEVPPEPEDNVNFQADEEEDEEEFQPPSPAAAEENKAAPDGAPPSLNAIPVLPPPKPKKREVVPFEMSLTDRCRTVMVTYLERYPPAVLGMLDPEEWAILIERRHKKTTPVRGSGGLDGTGRLTPAVTERFMASVEEANPHLKSSKTDILVWKDCVNMRFRSGGLTRPRMLEQPWPVMVDQIVSWGHQLESAKGPLNHDVIQRLQTAPMNVALLQATGIGKIIKKVIKSIKKEKGDDDPSGALDRLNQTLSKWKDLAAQQDKKSKQEDDWILAESCHSWRELYHGLAQREETRRSAQGQRMRKIRANLNADRPKVVKVQRAKKQHDRILAGTSGSSSSSFIKNGVGPAAHTNNSTLQKLRQETAAIAQRTAIGGRSISAGGGGFSAPRTDFARAVAVAACAKRKSNNAPPASSITSKRLKMSSSSPARRPQPPPSAPRRSVVPSALRKTPKSMPSARNPGRR